MKKKSNFKILKFIPVVVIILLLVIGLVYMNKSQKSSLTLNTTPTPIPTETPVPTETPTPNNFSETKISIPDYQFNVYVATYEEENGITDEDLRNNQDTRYAMYEDIYLSGYDHVDAAKEQEEGCTNEFIEEFRQYSLDRNLEKIPDPNATETPADTSDSGEYTIENYNKITDEEWAAMSDEEKQKWREVRNEELGGQSYDDVDKISEEDTQEAFDDLTDPNNPYIQDFLEYKASLNK